MMQNKSVSGTRRTYAVITGATSGLGLAYAKWFGGKGYDLIITGRRKDIIEKRAEEIREAYGCSVEVVLTDLAEEQGTAKLLARMDGMQMEIDILKETINVLKKTPASTRRPSKTGRRQ